MAKSTKALIVVILLAGICVYAVHADFYHVYTLRDDNGGEILWSGDQAYLFMTEVRRGYRLSLPDYAWAAVGEYFNAPPLPTDQRVFLSVIHVSPAGVERHLAFVTNDTATVPRSFTPFGKTIYTFCGGVLCKWAGDKFENATAEEQQRVGGAEQIPPDIDGPINGWMKRGIGSVAGDFQFSVQVTDQLSLKVTQGNVYKSVTDSAIVSLTRAGAPPEEIWHVNGDPRRVSKKEYERRLSTL